MRVFLGDADWRNNRSVFVEDRAMDEPDFVAPPPTSASTSSLISRVADQTRDAFASSIVVKDRAVEMPVSVAPPAYVPPATSPAAPVYVSTPAGPVAVVPAPSQGSQLSTPYGVDQRAFAQSLAPVQGDDYAGAVTLAPGAQAEAGAASAVSGRALLSLGILALSLFSR